MDQFILIALLHSTLALLYSAQVANPAIPYTHVFDKTDFEVYDYEEDYSENSELAQCRDDNTHTEVLPLVTCLFVLFMLPF